MSNYIDNAVFFGGMDNDNNPAFIKKGDYIYALNAVHNTTYAQGKYIISNEEGFSNFTNFFKKYPKDIILNITNIENILIIFSIVVDNSLNTVLSRIGIIDINGEYKEVLNDKDSSYWINGIINYKGLLNFNINYQIQTFARKIYNNDIVVYWVDELNAPRFLNVSKNYKDNKNKFKNIDLETRIFTKYDKPDIYIKDIILGGELIAGAYQFVCRYKTKEERYSEWGLISNVVYIIKTDEKKHIVEGANIDYGYINKAIKLQIYNIDNGYDYLEIAVIRYKGNASVPECFIFELANIKNINNTLEITFDGKKKIKDITIQEIIQKNVYYEVANVIAQKDNRLFLANLKSAQLIDLQPIANELIFKWKSDSYLFLDNIVPNYDKYDKLFDIDSGGSISINIQDDLLVSRGLKGFQREEVYSLGIVGVDEYGNETFAFHVPAKLPNQIDNTITLQWSPYNLVPTDVNNPLVSEANKIKAHSYQIFDFYNQDLTEYGLLGVYFSEAIYNDKGVYFDINGNDLYGKRIRHWLMPSYRMSPHFGYNNLSLYLKPLHLYIDNQHLLYLYNKYSDIFKRVKKLVLVRQKRDNPTNRGIYYMGLVNPMLIQDGFSKSHNSYTTVRNKYLDVTPDTNTEKFNPEAGDRGFSAIVSPFHGNCFIFDEDKVCFYNGRFTYEWLYKEFERNRLIYNNNTIFNHDYNVTAHINNLSDIDVYSYYEHILRHGIINRSPSNSIQLLSNEGTDPFVDTIQEAHLDVISGTCNINSIYNNVFSHFGFITLYKKNHLINPSIQNTFKSEDDKYTAVNKAKWYNKYLYQKVRNLDFYTGRSILFSKNLYNSSLFYLPLWYGKYTNYIINTGFSINRSKLPYFPHLYAWSGITDRVEGKRSIAFYSPETLFYDDIYIPINSRLKPILEIMAMPYRVNDLNIRRGKERNTNIDSGLDILLCNGDFGFIYSDEIVINEFENPNRDIRSGYWHIHHNWFFHVGKVFNLNKNELMLFLELPNQSIPLEYNDYNFNFSLQTNLAYPQKNYNNSYWNDIIFYQWIKNNDIIKSPQDYLSKLKYYLYGTTIKINHYDGEKCLIISLSNEIILPELQTNYYLALGNSGYYDYTSSYTIFDNIKNLEPQGLNNLVANNLLKFPKHILDWGVKKSNDPLNPNKIYGDFRINSNPDSCQYPIYFESDRRILEGYRDFDQYGNADEALYSNRYIYILDSQNKSQYGQLNNNEYIPFDIIYNDIDFSIIYDNIPINRLKDKLQNITSRTVLTNGDVYVSMFYYRNSNRIPFYYETANHKGYGGYGRIKTREGIELRSGNYIPIESEINCFYRHRPVQKDNDGYIIGLGVLYYPLCNEREALNPESEDASNVNYNPQYSFQNDKKIFFLYPRNVEFQEYFRNRIIYSDLHVEGSVKDYLLEFQPNSFQDIPKDKGEITNLFKIGNDMYAQTVMSLFKLFINPFEALNQNNLILSTSGIFQRPPIEIQSGISNSGGTMHKFSGLDTQFGYFFIDYFSKKAFLFGQTLEEISQYGMSNFFNNILNFEIDHSKDRIHNLSNKNGVGIYSVFDKTNNRILVTIKYGKQEDKYYTLSYNLLNKKWTSFHTYKISVAEEYKNSFVIANNESFNEIKFGKGGDYGKYFGDITNYFIIEYVFNKDFYITKVFDNIMVDLEIYNLDKDTVKYATVEERIKEKLAYLFFNEMICYTTYQNTDIIELILYNPNDINSDEMFSNVKYYNNQYNIKLQKNIIIDSEKFIFDNNNYSFYDNLNRLKDKYISIRFIYKNKENVLFLLKQCLLKYRINTR